jgi:hypothetical protein
MRTITKISLGALGLTLVFFGLAAIFMKIGPCGPSSDASAVFFVILLPALVLADSAANGNSVVAWSVIAVWVYALSWAISGITSWGFRRIKNR